MAGTQWGARSTDAGLPWTAGDWTHLQPSGGPVIEKKGAPLVQVADPKCPGPV